MMRVTGRLLPSCLLRRSLDAIEAATMLSDQTFCKLKQLHHLLV